MNGPDGRPAGHFEEQSLRKVAKVIDDHDWHFTEMEKQPKKAAKALPR
jgi:hypothetical protein